jgi:hypothetical protein
VDEGSTSQREAFLLEFAEMIVPVLGTEKNRKTKVFITGGLRSVGTMVKALDVVMQLVLGDLRRNRALRVIFLMGQLWEL